MIKKQILLVLCTLIMACNLPKDPEQSWEHVQDYGLRVGLVAGIDDQKKEGLVNSERQLMEAFAKAHGMETHIIKAHETALVNKLKKYELDVLIGGFDKKSQWNTEVGMTAPYDGTHVLFVPKGENELLFHLEQFLYKHK